MTDELDEDTLGRMIRYCGQDPRIRGTVTEEMFEEYGEASWAVGEFLTLIAAAADKIPTELRGSAKVVLGGEYGESVCLTISYVRPETDEEVANRVTRAVQYARNRQAEERATYEALKRKFG